ncbi:MAG: trypsin-like peptidase domain-containing protein, partial [Acidimicrobiales bacterium]
MIAGVAILAAGFGGGVGTALFVRRGASKTAGSPPTPGSAPNQIDLSALASKIDPAIVDLQGIQRDANGKAVAVDAGTGVIITSNGEVLTNNHVIAGNSSMTARLSTGRTVTVKVLGEDPTADVALVQLEGVSGLPTVNITSGARASISAPVAAFGNALGSGGAPS